MIENEDQGAVEEAQEAAVEPEAASAAEAAPATEAVTEVAPPPPAPPAPEAPMAPPPPPAPAYAPPPPPAPGYAPPAAPPQQAYGIPAPTIGTKNKVVAGVLGILLGALGIHKFYLGYNKEGLIMLVVTVLLSWTGVGPAVVGLIGLIEGIMYITKTDEDFYQTYEVGQKPWF